MGIANRGAPERKHIPVECQFMSEYGGVPTGVYPVEEIIDRVDGNIHRACEMNKDAALDARSYGGLTLRPCSRGSRYGVIFGGLHPWIEDG